MIDTIVFDIGTVLVDFEWDRYINNMFTDEATLREVHKAMFLSGIWDEVDRGVWTEQEVVDAFIRLAPEYREEIQRAYYHLPMSLIKCRHTDGWIHEMKQRGYRVLFLSNYARYIMERIPETFAFMDDMDGGVLSCDVQLLKPDTAIYAELCRQYALEPQQCLFIDDRKENIEAAQAYGMHAVWFETYEQAYADMNALLKQQ